MQCRSSWTSWGWQENLSCKMILNLCLVILPLKILHGLNLIFTMFPLHFNMSIPTCVCFPLNSTQKVKLQNRFKFAAFKSSLVHCIMLLRCSGVFRITQQIWEIWEIISSMCHVCPCILLVLPHLKNLKTQIIEFDQLWLALNTIYNFLVPWSIKKII